MNFESLLEGNWLARKQSDRSDERSGSTSDVDQHRLALIEANLGMTARDRLIAEDEDVLRKAADRERRRRRDLEALKNRPLERGDERVRGRCAGRASSLG